MNVVSMNTSIGIIMSLEHNALNETRATLTLEQNRSLLTKHHVTGASHNLVIMDKHQKSTELD